MLYVNSTFSRNDSAVATIVHDSERSRLYNEGDSRCPNKDDVSSPQGIEDASCCDPNQESISGKSFSVAKVETVYRGHKLEDSQIGNHKLSNDHPLVLKHISREKVALQDEHKMDNVGFLDDLEVRKTTQSWCNSVQVNTSAKETNPMSASCREVGKAPAELSLCNESRKRVASTTSPNFEKSDRVSWPVSSPANDVGEVILAQQLPFKNAGDIRRENISISPDDDNSTIITVVHSVSVLPEKFKGESGEPVSTTQLHNKTVKDTPYADEQRTNANVDSKPKIKCENVDGTKSITFSSVVIPSVKPTIDTNSGKSVFMQEQKEMIIRSPILPKRKTNGNPRDVNVIIDYRNKRPVSVEYTVEDVSFLTTLGTSAKTLRKNKQSGSVDCKAGAKRNSTSCLGLKSDDYNKTTINGKEVGNPLITLQDIHEKDASTYTTNQIRPGKIYCCELKQRAVGFWLTSAT